MTSFTEFVSRTEHGSCAEEDIEDIEEQAVAGYGDWSPAKNRILEKSLKQLEAEFEFIDKISINKYVLDLYKMKSKTVYILGKKDINNFKTIFHIELKERKDVEQLLNNPSYSKIMNVDGVIVEESMRGYGIAKTMYQYLVKKLGYTVLGDEIQYHKARLTWASLSNMDTVVVDIFDIVSGTILEKNIVLHHGVEDHDFDERVWDYTHKLENIRLLLTDVK